MKRVKMFSFHPDTIADLLRTGSAFEITRGIHKNAKVINSGFDVIRQQVFIVAEHESFPEIQDGCIIGPETVEAKTISSTRL